MAQQAHGLTLQIDCISAFMRTARTSPEARKSELGGLVVVF